MSFGYLASGKIYWIQQPNVKAARKKKPVAIPSVTPFKRHANEKGRNNKESIEVGHFAHRIFFIEHPRRLFQTWPGKPGVY